jgi:hypothetical protein
MNGLNPTFRLFRGLGPTVFLLAACYTQVPLTSGVPAPATRVIATLTDTGIVVMSNTIGPGAEEVEGTVIDADANAWRLNLVRVDQRGGTSVLWNREPVTFPRYTLKNPMVKQVDKTRSWMAGTLVAVGAILAAKLFSNIGADENPQQPPPPPQIRVPGRGSGW